MDRDEAHSAISRLPFAVAFSLVCDTTGTVNGPLGCLTDCGGKACLLTDCCGAAD